MATYALWLLDDNVKPHRHAFHNFLDQTKAYIERIQFAYSPNVSLCDYGASWALEKAAGVPAYPTIDSFREAIG